MSRERPTSGSGGGGEEKAGEQLEQQIGVNSYGTDDPKAQARIEAARAAASAERKRDRAEWERYVNAGINEEDAAGLVEFRHYVRDRQQQEHQAVADWAQSSGQEPAAKPTMDPGGRGSPGSANVEPREPGEQAGDIYQVEVGTGGIEQVKKVERRRSRSPRIYVACLASYNQGILHGLWIDADQEASELSTDIDAMLAASPVVGAEEYAIHDSEGFRGFEIGEHEDLVLVSRVARGIARHGEAFAAYLSWAGSSLEAAGKFHDSFVGTFISAEEWARDNGYNLEWEHQVEERLDPDLVPYVRIDYQAFARDMASQWHVIEGEEGVHVFAP